MCSLERKKYIQFTQGLRRCPWEPSFCFAFFLEQKKRGNLTTFSLRMRFPCYVKSTSGTEIYYNVLPRPFPSWLLKNNSTSFKIQLKSLFPALRIRCDFTVFSCFTKAIDTTHCYGFSDLLGSKSSLS